MKCRVPRIRVSKIDLGTAIQKVREHAAFNWSQSHVRPRLEDASECMRSIYFQAGRPMQRRAS